MIKKRFGETFAEAIKANLEIKTPEVARKDARGGKRKPRENNKGERKPREQKDEKKEDKPAAEEAPKQEAKK